MKSRRATVSGSEKGVGPPLPGRATPSHNGSAVHSQPQLRFTSTPLPFSRPGCSPGSAGVSGETAGMKVTLSSGGTASGWAAKWSMAARVRSTVLGA